jgi:hypothetical protein
VTNDGARYQPVAWWFTKRRLERELRNLHQAAEQLPPELLAFVRKLEGKLAKIRRRTVRLVAASMRTKPTVVTLEGRPLTRDEEHRITAQTTLAMAEFTAMFLLGMLCGASAVFIAHFMR